jgi:SAM-dependent methyltransferase
VLDPGVLDYVLESLPAAPARVLEVGAGAGELAAALMDAGYDVVAIDPAADGDTPVQAVPLHELREPGASFSAAVAVVSLHHVNPLAESCRRLAELVRPGGALVVDEIDVERYDERTMRWWLDHRESHDHVAAHGEELQGPGEIVAWLRHHCHGLGEVQAALEEWFELGPVTRGPYLYRWQLPPGMRATEEELIAAGRLPATGVRFLGTRRPGTA